jgi:hypothetical protein
MTDPAHEHEHGHHERDVHRPNTQEHADHPGHSGGAARRTPDGGEQDDGTAGHVTPGHGTAGHGTAGHGTHGQDSHSHDSHSHDSHSSVDRMAVAATLHCLTGCAIGEIVGMLIGTGLGLANGWTIVISIGLAFVFGFGLSTLPLLKAGLGLGAALGLVVAADTLSIATMEVVDNLVVAVIPGAMDAGLVNIVFWISLTLSLVVAFGAAYPVNRFQLQRGKGHALTHGYHDDGERASGARRFIPTLRTGSLVAVIVAFLLGGFVVSLADRLG